MRSVAFILVACLLAILAVRPAGAALFKVDTPTTWKKVFSAGEDKQIYFNSQSKHAERIVLQMEAISQLQDGDEGLSSSRKNEFSQRRSEFFAASGLHGYTVFEIENRNQKSRDHRRLTVIRSRYQDLRGADVQMLERQYLIGHRLYTVTYLIDAPALNDSARAEFVMDQFLPLPTSSREPASEAVQSAPVGPNTPSSSALKNAIPGQIKELEMSDPANQKYCAAFCHDDPSKCRNLGEPSFDESLKESSMLNKGWGCLVGLKDGVWGMAQGVYDIVAFAVNYGASLVTGGVYSAQVHAAVGAVAAEFVKEPAAFTERIASAIAGFIGQSLGDFFYCANNQEQWRQICDVGTNLIPVGIVIKMAAKIPLVAKEIEIVSNAGKRLRGKTFGRTVAEGAVHEDPAAIAGVQATALAAAKPVAISDLAKVRPEVANEEFAKTEAFRSLSPEMQNAVSRAPAPFIYDSDLAAVGGDKTKAFVTGGVNSDEVLRNTPSITGVKLKDLNLRSAATGGTFSTDPAGFSGPFSESIGLRRSSEGLLSPDIPMREQLLKDNQLVRELGLTHQQVASPLIEILKNVESSGIKDTRESLTKEIKIGNETYSVKVTLMPGGGNTFSAPKGPSAGWRSSAGPTTQGSIFNDSLFSNWAYEIKNARGEILRGDALTPQMIHRYGFYQGGPYRMDPRAIINFFHLTP